MEYISLGSNCSITYQLGKLGLRNNSYPFDWTKISLTQLIKILENDFFKKSNTKDQLIKSIIFMFNRNF